MLKYNYYIIWYKMLIIDSREHKLIELIKSIPNFNIQYVIQQLQIGDIIIQYKMPTGKPNNNTNTTNYIFNIIVERKYITDMIASVKDGRYKEQKIRLIAECVKPNIDILTNDISITNDITTNIIHCKLACYIIEGLQSNLRMQQEKTILIGSIISSVFRDKLPILRTNTLQQTLDMIVRLHDRLAFDYTDFFTILKPTQMPISIPIPINTITNDIAITTLTAITPLPIQDTPQDIINNNNNININNKLAENMYLQSIKKCKKDNMTPQLWAQMCYMNIPGISNIIAIKIAEIYPTIKLLLLAYEKCSNETEKDLLLANIVLDNTETSTITNSKHNRNNRHIGNVISKRVCEYVNM